MKLKLVACIAFGAVLTGCAQSVDEEAQATWDACQKIAIAINENPSSATMLLYERDEARNRAKNILDVVAPHEDKFPRLSMAFQARVNMFTGEYDSKRWEAANSDLETAIDEYESVCTRAALKIAK